MKESTAKYSARSLSGESIRVREETPSILKRGKGVVSYYVHGLGEKAVDGGITATRLIQVIRGGLPFQELEELQVSLEIPMEKLASKLGISKATLHRRKVTGKLDPGESDRIVRFARLMGKAIEVMESKENGRQWLTSTQLGLGGAVPLDYAETEVGAREVEDLLGRIEYGVYA
jgi:putative toxin-antitoxin system antitoxin component (TIGR02293 family)